MTGLNTVIFWSVAAITVAASLLLSYSIFRFQRKVTHQSPTDAGDFRDNGVLGFIWTLVPVAILTILLALAFQTMQV